MFNFYEYFKNIDVFAVIDIIIFVLVLALFTVFYVKKKQIAVLLIFLALVAVGLALNIVSYVFGGTVLTAARIIMLFLILCYAFANIVIYSNDLKLFFQKITKSGSNTMPHESFGGDDELRTSTLEILTACQNMAKRDIGAIILITGESEFPKTVIDTGTELNATLSSGLIESIFNTEAPLHDGAIVVKGNKILSAGCFLPVTQKLVNKEMGARHRAAIGITEECNCLAIVVSEETGIISTVKGGDIKRYITMEKLKDEIERAYHLLPADESGNITEKKHARFK